MYACRCTILYIRRPLLTDSWLQFIKYNCMCYSLGVFCATLRYSTLHRSPPLANTATNQETSTTVAPPIIPPHPGPPHLLCITSQPSLTRTMRIVMSTPPNARERARGAARLGIPLYTYTVWLSLVFWGRILYIERYTRTFIESVYFMILCIFWICFIYFLLLFLYFNLYILM